MLQKINYQVMTGDAEGKNWINNVQVRVGQTVKLTEQEAKYLELSGQVEKKRDLGALKAKATKAKEGEAKPAPEVEKE